MARVGEPLLVGPEQRGKSGMSGPLGPRLCSCYNLFKPQSPIIYVLLRHIQIESQHTVI